MHRKIVLLFALLNFFGVNDSTSTGQQQHSFVNGSNISNNSSNIFGNYSVPMHVKAHKLLCWSIKF